MTCGSNVTTSYDQRAAHLFAAAYSTLKHAPEFAMNQSPSPVKIKAHVRIENGRLISAANARRLVVRGRTDISKNVIGLGITPDYRETYLILHESKGFIWREVTHGMGINGHHASAQKLVRTTAAHGYEIEVLPEPMPDHLFAATQRIVDRLEHRFIS